MVEGNRMFQMSESLKECLEAISQQQVVNTNVDQNLTDLNPSLPNTKHPASIPVKKISPFQMSERREKWLCYNCEEKWNPSHKCKTPKLYMMTGIEQPMKEKIEEVYYEVRRLNQQDATDNYDRF
jgi:hypothetical protein